jgi:5-formyltetrahydrofolate cyclo-ligase
MVLIQKSVLRKEALRKRKKLQQTDECNQTVERLFFKYLNPPKDKIVSAYWAKECTQEFDASFILNALDEKGVKCALPVTTKGKRIVGFHEWHKDTKMTAGLHDIMEPPSKGQALTPDIIICPLLAFDRKGYRLGYGGGCYDATLEDIRKVKPNAILVGFAFDEQKFKFNLPHEDHDIPCDWIITPTRAIEFCHTTQTRQVKTKEDRA